MLSNTRKGADAVCAATQAVQAKVTEDPADMRVPCAGKIGDGGNMDKVQVRGFPTDSSQHVHRSALGADCCTEPWGRHSGERFLPSLCMFSDNALPRCTMSGKVNVRRLRLQVDPRLAAEQQDAMRRRMLAMTQQQQRLNGDRIAQQLSRAYQRVIGGKFS